MYGLGDTTPTLESGGALQPVGVAPEQDTTKSYQGQDD
jgi:hypothetical protein